MASVKLVQISRDYEEKSRVDEAGSATAWENKRKSGLSTGRQTPLFETKTGSHKPKLRMNRNWMLNNVFLF